MPVFTSMTDLWMLDFNGMTKTLHNSTSRHFEEQSDEKSFFYIIIYKISPFGRNDKK